MEALLTLMLKQLLAATVAMAMIKPGLTMTRNNASCSTLPLVELVAMVEAGVQRLHD